MFKRGTRVVIPKGTIIWSTYPGWPLEGRPAGRTYEVSVWNACWDQTEERDNGIILSKGRITWAGTGGYWKWCDSDLVREAPSDLERLAAAGK
jgi:hypothetical protein